MGMARAKAEPEGQAIVIPPLRTGKVKVWIRGESPLIFNCMSEKARRELLYPKGRKTAADKASSLKHEPMEEYRNSVYRYRDDEGPTRLHLPATAIKGALMTAALEIEGVKKAQIGRLVWVKGYNVPVWGVTDMFMAVVRSADMNRTPDIRTRAIVPEWCACAEIQFVEPVVNETTIARLLAMAGVVVGVGDYRQEKGKGNFGQFSLCEEADVKALIKSGARKAQDAALESCPHYYDVETENLYEWYVTERKARGEKNKTQAAKAAAAG